MKIIEMWQAGLETKKKEPKKDFSNLIRQGL